MLTKRTSLFLLFLALPISADQPPVPWTLPVEPPLVQNLRSPKDSVFRASLGVRMAKPAAVTALRVTPGPRLVGLTWNYDPALLTNTLFELAQCLDLSLAAAGQVTNSSMIPPGFILFSTIDNTTCSVTNNGAQAYYIVRALDRTTGKRSAWNQ